MDKLLNEIEVLRHQVEAGRYFAEEIEKILSGISSGHIGLTESWHLLKAEVDGYKRVIARAAVGRDNVSTHTLTVSLETKHKLIEEHGLTETDFY